MRLLASCSKPLPVLLGGAILAAGLFAAEARGYPITPHPLRKLAAGADAIVVGRVAEIAPETAAHMRSSSAIAVLDVEEVLKGDALRGALEVPFAPNMLCPAPARYERGMPVMAFLTRAADGGWRTFALRYGARDLSAPGAREALTLRVCEMLSLLSGPEGPERRAEIIAWLVRCALEPATRWDGAYELARTADDPGFDESKPDGFGDDLDQDQLEALVEAAIASDSLHDGGGVTLVRLLVRHGAGGARLTSRLHGEVARLARLAGQPVLRRFDRRPLYPYACLPLLDAFADLLDRGKAAERVRAARAEIGRLPSWDGAAELQRLLADLHRGLAADLNLPVEATDPPQ